MPASSTRFSRTPTSFRWRMGFLLVVSSMLVVAHIQVGAAEDPSIEVQRLIRSGQSAQAAERLDKALVDHPRDAQLRFLRGVMQSDAGHQAEAIQTFDQLSVDHPELPEPYNNLAVLYASQGDYERAKSELEAALRARPGYAVAFQNLGDVYLQLSRLAYQQALELDPNNAAIRPKLSMLRDLVALPRSTSSTTNLSAP